MTKKKDLWSADFSELEKRARALKLPREARDIMNVLLLRVNNLTGAAEEADRRKDRAIHDIKNFNDVGTLALRIFQDLGYDVWGSSTLHFNGDCFDEHEWSCLAQGGTFGDTKRVHGSGTDPLMAVLACLRNKIKAIPRGCKKGSWARKMRDRMKFYLEAYKEIIRAHEKKAREYQKTLFKEKPVD